MHCPHCGAEQPHELKCIRCETDFGRYIQDEKRSILAYRIAAGVLLIMVFWLFFDHRNATKHEAEPSDVLPVETPQNAAAFEKTITAFPNVSPPPPPSAGMAILNKRHFADYQILQALRESVTQPFEIYDLSEENEFLEAMRVQENPTILIGIGKEGTEFLLQRRDTDDAQILLSTEITSDDPNLKKPNIYLVRNVLPADKELNLLHRLLPDKSQMILIKPEKSAGPTAEALAQAQIGLMLTYPPDAITLEREITSAQTVVNPDNAIVWLHGLTDVEKRKIMKVAALDKLVVVAGLNAGVEKEVVTRDKKKESESTPFMELMISPQGLGTQGALLLSRLAQNQTPTDEEQNPQVSLEIVVHVSKALALSQEAWIGEIKKRAWQQGHQFRLEH